MAAVARPRRRLSRTAVIALLLALAALLVGVERYSDKLQYSPIQYEGGDGGTSNSGAATAVNGAADFTG